jgi:hypothetical protein
LQLEEVVELVGAVLVVAVKDVDAVFAGAQKRTGSSVALGLEERVEALFAGRGGTDPRLNVRDPDLGEEKRR